LFKVERSKRDFVDKEAIEKSDVFLAIITKNWIQEPLRIEELEYAKSLGKLIAVAVLDGVNPEPYLKNAKIIAKRVFDRKQVESGSPLAQALIADFIMEVKEKLEKFKEESSHE
jgi:hypothetical protein